MPNRSFEEALSAYRQSPNVPEGTFRVKLIFLGDTNVGKTSLVVRFVEGQFLLNFKTTLGANIMQKKQAVRENTQMDWIIFDMGGQASYSVFRQRFYMGTGAVFLVVDKTQPQTLYSIEERWLGELDDVGINLRNTPAMVIANKTDLAGEIKLSTEDIAEFSQKYRLKFIETSAKTGENVEEAFELISYEKLLQAE